MKMYDKCLNCLFRCLFFQTVFYFVFEFSINEVTDISNHWKQFSRFNIQKCKGNQWNVKRLLWSFEYLWNSIAVLFRRINWPPKQVASHYIVFSGRGGHLGLRPHRVSPHSDSSRPLKSTKKSRILVENSPRETSFLPILRPVDREASWSDTTVVASFTVFLAI